MDPLYIVDGSGYIFRAYYAVAPLSTSKGLPTNALLGFTRMLIKLIREESADYIAVTFDTKEPTFRHRLYDKYKANREACPEDLIPQMPYFRSIVKALGIKCLEKPGFEADDIIASITQAMKNNDQEVRIVSGDKDLTQLIRPGVKVWDAMREIVYDAGAVKAKFGVEPEQMLDYLTLVGDSSDNVPGLKGVGAKTAQILISHFGSIEKMLEDTSEIEKIAGLRGSKGVRAKVEAGKDQIYLSKQLIALDYNVSPFSDISEKEEYRREKIEIEQVVTLFEELEFNRIIDSVTKLDNGNYSNQSRFVSNVNGKKVFDYTIVDETTIDEFVEELSKQNEFAFDTETSSLDTKSCELIGISFSWKDYQGFYLPVGGEAERERHLDLNRIRKIIGPIFADEKVKKIGLNLKFDLNVLVAQGFEVNGCDFDSMLASYVLAPDGRSNGLKALTKRFLHETMVTFEEVVEDKENIGQVEIDRVGKYACHDADASFRLRACLQAELDKAGDNPNRSPNRVFREIEMPLVPVLAQMERLGIKVDAQFLKDFENELAIDLKKLEESIYEQAGQEFNINSPKQLSEILFDKLALPTFGSKMKQSGFSTGAGVLEQLAKEFSIAQTILDYRELFKLQTTYVVALQGLINPRTRRIHTSFNQAIAATGRLSSSDPNLQNIPIRSERGRKIRNAFIAEAGYQLISADYSQIELRIVADMSGDKNLIDAFNRGEDIHLATAKDIFGHLLVGANTEASQLKEYRRIAKTINFGIIYGIGASRLASSLEIPRKTAQEYIDNYFSRYRKVKEFLDQIGENAEKLGFTETLFGRKRYANQIDSAGRDKGYAVRSLINFPIQGTASEVIKLAMINLHNEFKAFGEDARIILQVHDELVVEAKDNKVEEITNIVVRQMEGVAQLSVPLKVDVKVGKTWGDEK
jgi:DNA polymerase I